MIQKEKIKQSARIYSTSKNRGFEGAEYIVRSIASEYDFKAGVEFAEAELMQTKTFEIDFCGHVKAKIEINNGTLTVIAAMNGYGDALDPDQIAISELFDKFMAERGKNE